MAYSLINICILISLYWFYRMYAKNQSDSSTFTLLPIINVCALQAGIVSIMFVLNLLNINTSFFDRLYIFSVYYSLLVFFKYACNYEAKKEYSFVSYLVIIGIVLTLYYCFFYIDFGIHENVGSKTLPKEISFLSLFNLGHYAYTPYAFVPAAISILVLLIRSFFTNNNVIRFKLALMILLYISVICFYIFLVFGGITKHPLNFLFAFVTLYVLLVLNRISLINHVISLRKAVAAIRIFFFEYMFFAFIVAIAFVTFFLAMQLHFVFFAFLGSIIVLFLFFVQAAFRKKNKENYLRDVADVALGNFFATINYEEGKEIIINSFQHILMEVFDSSAIEFYILEEDVLRVAYSSRDFYAPRISVKCPLFSKLHDLETPVLTPTCFIDDSNLKDMQDEILSLLTYCNSKAMITIHGDRQTIGLIAFSEKHRSIDYSSNDVALMRYFYPDFFVFGYYLQISMKETLMNIISREIEFSGQVTESISKNIDRVQNSTIDMGYLSRSLRNLGGDFIDLIRLTDERHMFVVGDVSGRGLNASMCMIILKSFIRTFLAESNDFLGLINKLNGFIKHNLPRGTFFAGTFMIYDNKNNMLYYVNCGVPSIFLYTKSYNNVIEIQGEGKILGFASDVSELLSVKKIQLNPGDIVLTCSDGVTESLSLRGEEYGKRRIENLLLENKLFPAQNICSFLYDDLQAFTAKGISDDVSILLLKILG